MIDLLVNEKELYNKGYIKIAGTDEAGRGPLAGPLVASAVILPKDIKFDNLINDSKKLTPKQREKAYYEIIQKALAISTVFLTSKQVDEYNPYQASKIAMQKAIKNLSIKPDFILTDAMPLEEKTNFLAIIKGDQKSLTIACASIVAKYQRDLYMDNLDQMYPLYDFKKNKGYPTKHHLKMLKEVGITDEHRKTYKPVKAVL